MSAFFAAGIALWLALVVIAAARMTGNLIGFSLAEPRWREFAPPDTVTAAVTTIGLCMVATVVARALRPRATWAALLTTAAAIVTTVAVLTHSVTALTVTVALSCLVWVGGELLLVLMRESPSPAIVRVPLAASLGTGLFGLLWLILGALHRLDAASVLVSSGLTLAALIFAARAKSGEWPVVSIDRDRTPPGWYETVLLSLSGGIITFALLGAFVPESISDATRQHLPIAREFWQAHGLVILETMSVSWQSIQNHVVFAVAYGFGGLTAVMLVQAAIGVASIAGVAALGWLLHGRFAALVAACVFGTMPIVLWELGHAFIDMLPVLLTAGALTCVVLWQRHDRLAWLVLAGALAGIGVSTKLTMAALVVAIAAGVFLVGRAPWNFRERVVSSAAYCLGALTMVPWLIHLAMGTGTLPGLDALLSRVSRFTALIPGQAPAVSPGGESAGLADAGGSDVAGPPADWVPFGHTLLDLLRLPWTLTFAGERFAFPVVGRGEVGIAPLLLIPFSVLGGVRRPTALLGLVALLSYVAWWLTPYQISRHLLPTLAVVAVLGGCGLATLVERRSRPRWQVLLTGMAQVALLVSIGLAPVFFVAGPLTRMPIALLTGNESPETFVRDSIEAATPLLASSEMLPPDTPVAFLGGMWDAPQIYTEARLVFLPGNSAGATSDDVLTTLQQYNIRYIIWNRGTSPTRDSSSMIRSTPFLEQHTRILAGDNDAYLFEVLPAGDTVWGVPDLTNLLEDPGLQQVKGRASPWAIEGKSLVTKGVVTLQRRSTLTQEVDVAPGHAYLLQAPMRCLDASGRGIFTLRWLDATGSVLDTDSEEVLPGHETSEQFLWRRAPDGAVRVQAEFSMAGPSRCEFSGAALYDLG